MDCRAVLEEVNNYLDRQVHRSVAEQIQLHLSCCRNCRIVYDTVAKTVRLYCENRQQVPEAVRQRIRQALKAVAEEPLRGPLEARAEGGFGILRVRREATVPPEKAVALYAETRHLPPELHDRVARRAHEIFLERGGAPGHEVEDWVRAEGEILSQEAEATSEETTSS